MKFVVSVLVAIILVQTSFAFNTLPPWIITKCARGPTFNDCALKTAQQAFNHAINGDQTYHIPSFNPLKVAKVSLQSSSTGSLKLFGVGLEIFGFDKADLKTLDWNFEEKVIKIHIFFPTIMVLGTYKMNGRILILNLEGSGPMNITFHDQDFDLQVYYKLEEVNNKEYIKLTKVDMQIHSETCIMEFKNLFNNPVISKQMNAFLNENWRTVITELDPSIMKVIESIILEIINYISSRIPYEELFES